MQVECYRCHRPSEVHDARKDRRGWESTVRRMEAHGMDVMPEERETIVEWLAETQPLE
ncbi:MAG: hypothetical protein IBX62_03495 [Coriobacteriia bacterium]|nr:hypothetical protein [Coriobacteriia bacterium]